MSVLTVDQQFPNIIGKNFYQKDRICHSLIEATYLYNFYDDFVLSMLNYLAYYEQENESFVIDLLFMKYLKKYHQKVDQAIQNKFILSLMTKGLMISQYHIALICYCDEDNIFNVKSQFISQAWKLNTENENILINGYELSFTVASCLMKYYKIPYNDGFIDQIYISDISDYNALLKNIDHYYPLCFWKSIDIPNDLTIVVNDNPYLFHAAACLNLYNQNIKMKFDVKMLDLPENFTYELIILTQKILSKEDLLDIQLTTTQNKNLCTLIYLLLKDNVPYIGLKEYQNIINQKSFIILSIIYSNYLKKDISSFLAQSIYDIIDYKNSKDIILAKLYISICIPRNIELFNENLDDLLYIVPKNNFNSKMNKKFKDSIAYYGFLKKRFFHNDFRIEGKEIIFNNNKSDFSRFVKCSFFHLPIHAQNYIYRTYDFDQSDTKMKMSLFIIQIMNKNFFSANKIMHEIIPTEYELSMFRNIDFSLIDDYSSYSDADDFIEVFNKFQLKKIYNKNQLKTLYYNINFPTRNVFIDRDKFLKSSIKSFKKVYKNRIRISFKNELGIDCGGLSKDFYTTIADEILQTEIFKLVPNGTSLTINENNIDLNLIYFTGKIIGSAFTNKRNINVKLASFIWKMLLNEQITLDDMKYYDIDIYKSLHWISQNDPEPLMLTFVNSNNEELCPNGKDIEVTEDNKNEYIKLQMKNIFIRKKEKAFVYLLNGFKETVAHEILIEFIDYNEFKELLCGNDTIDVKDWKRNTRCEMRNQMYMDRFFNVISKWTQEKLKKLLKFVTGSTVVPIGGFKYLSKVGGTFTLNFYDDNLDNLPVAHTCFNSMDIPCYKTEEIFDTKLSFAIESVEYGIY